MSYEGNFPDRQWDVSQIGLVFVSKKEFKRRDKARKAAKEYIETWNKYLAGDVYGCIIEEYDTEKKPVKYESCWGYYGYESALKDLQRF